MVIQRGSSQWCLKAESTENQPSPHADARLIAAAPELLEALERYVAEVEEWVGDIEPWLKGDGLDGEKETYRKAKAAIAKARGCAS